MLALHADVPAAAADLAALTGPAGFPGAVAGGAILDRTPRGIVVQQSGGGTVGYGIGTGAAAGIVAGVFVDQPLIGGAIGAAIGGLVGRRMRRGEVATVERVLDDYIPMGSVALAAVVAAEPWPIVRGSLGKALRVTGWPLDGDSPLLPFARSLVRGNPTASEHLAFEPPDSAGRAKGP